MLIDLKKELLATEGIVPDLLQPRRSSNLADHETLKASIAAHGILQPILVRWDETRKLYVIIFGERRWLCAKELGLKHVPCLVTGRELSAAEILMLQLIENIQRESLNPMDEARSLERLQGLLKCSREDLTVHVQRSAASICRSFKLLELPADLQALVEVGNLPISVAVELHRCSDPVIQRELAERYAAGGMNREDVVASLQRMNAAKSTTKPKTLTLTLAKGMTLRVSGSTSLKDCEKTVATWLRRLRDAKRNVTDLAGFAAEMQTEADAGK